MRLYFAGVTFLALALRPASADIVLGAPGVPVGSQVVTKLPFKNNVTLPNSYKFVFAGIQAKGNTLGAPGASGTNGNGGQFHLTASASGGGDSAREGKIDFRDVQDYNTAPLKTILTSPAVVFKAVTSPIAVSLEWKGEGNAKKPDGFFNILGEYQKDPPVPKGSLSFVAGQWVLADSPSPQGEAKIVRE